jgi:hypothetical protein
VFADVLAVAVHRLADAVDRPAPGGTMFRLEQG